MKVKQIIQVLIATIIFFGFPYQNQAKSETILEEIKRTGLIKFALRKNAVPFGYRDLDNNLSGLCLDLFQILRKKIQQELNQDILLVKLYSSNLSNRFTVVENRVVYLECGPNTIREGNNKNIEFSRPFFVTGTQFLVKADNKNKFNLNRGLNNVSIGVLVNTSNEEFIRQKYPGATLKEFQGILGRKRGIQAVQKGQIDAFASDGILLLGEAILQNLSLGQDYLLIPSHPLNCDYYGLILPKNDPQWRDLVNSVLGSLKEQQIANNWFGLVQPYIKSTLDYCREEE
jgi:polar amino acid transport system substrate-binding protein